MLLKAQQCPTSSLLNVAYVKMELVLDIERAKIAKLKLKAGLKPSVVAAQMGLPYMVVYKLAIGQTWKHVVVDGVSDGRLIGQRGLRMTKELRDKMFKAKQTKGVTNERLAKLHRMSETMVAKAMRDARALLAARVHRTLLTSGNNDVAVEQFGVTSAEADELVTYAIDNPLPERLRAELED